MRIPWYLLLSIRHLDKPSCMQCKHYLPELQDTFSSSSAKCTQFGGKDLHTGQVIYDYATSVRSDESKCSTQGTYFVGEKELVLKKIVYWMKQHLPSFSKKIDRGMTP